MGYLDQALNFLKAQQPKKPQVSFQSGDLSDPEIRDRVSAFIAGLDCPSATCKWTGSQLHAWMPLVEGLLLPHGEEGLLALSQAATVPIVEIINLVNTEAFYQVFHSPFDWLKDRVKPRYASAVKEFLRRTDVLAMQEKFRRAREEKAAAEDSHHPGEKSEVSELSLAKDIGNCKAPAKIGVASGVAAESRIQCADCVHYRAGTSSLHALGSCTSASWDGHRGQWPFRQHHCWNFQITG